MKYEESPKPRSPSYEVIEHILSETNDDLSEEILSPLLEDMDNPRSFALLVRYLKKNIKTRLPDLIRSLNFDFGTNPKSFNACNNLKEKIEQLLVEKDGVIDESKREQARLLLKVIKNTRVME